MPWFDSYRAYDDDTLTALANAGLLRRAAKDVEAGKVGWAEQGEEGGVVAADGQRVQLDARGPQQAHCDCPAPGICKHILGAALWLRALPATAEAAAQEEQAEAAPSPLAEVLALDPAVLFKAAGIAAVRRAAATPPGTLAWREQAGVLLLELPELGVACRWVAGAGFAGMVSEVPAAERKAVHLMALAALRQEHGQPLPWPAGAQPAPVDDSARLSERERAFLAQVEGMLRELVEGGLAHVSPLTSARLLALNMSARSEGLPRLAALLRNLGGTVDLLVRRDHRAEERDALAQMAQIHALCAALAQAEGDLARALRGRLRRDFDGDGQQVLTLLPVGAHWWQTRGGARGLTLAFWDPAGARLLQAALARPDAIDPSFTRHGAWTTQALWPGIGPAQRVCEGALELSAPRLAEDGRLALAGSTKARALPMWANDDARLADIGCGDWAQLAERLRAATGLAGEPLDALLLRPAEARAPQLDEVRQCLDWELADARGRWLRLGLPAGEDSRDALDNLDRLMARRPAVRAVLVRVARGDARGALVPVAVLANGPQGRLEIVSLGFANEAARPTSLANRILRLFEARRQQAQAPVADAPTLAGRLLAPVADVLETQAATGRLPFTPAQAQALQESLPRLASVGLDTLAGALRAHLQAPGADGLLRLAYLCTLLAETEGLP